MGYSCSAIANLVLQAAIKEAQGNRGISSSNGWDTPMGRYCFYERGRENPDGRITGSVYAGDKEPDGITPFRRIGSVNISKDGKISAFAGLQKHLWPRAEATALAEFIALFGQRQAEHDCYLAKKPKPSMDQIEKDLHSAL